MRQKAGRRISIGAVTAVSALLLTGCADEPVDGLENEGSVSETDTEETSSQDNKSDSAGNDTFGTFTVEGETFEIVEVYGGQVPVEDNAWRTIAEFENGEAIFNEGGSLTVYIDGDRVWNESSGESNTRIEVNESGAKGETTVYLTGDTQHLVQLVADISC